MYIEFQYYGYPVHNMAFRKQKWIGPFFLTRNCYHFSLCPHFVSCLLSVQIVYSPMSFFYHLSSCLFIVIRRLFLIKFSFFLTFLVWFHGFSSSFVILLITHETPAVQVLFSLKQTNHIDTCFLPYGVISRSCIGIIFFLTIEKRRPLDLFSMFLFCILFHKYIFS